MIDPATLDEYEREAKLRRRKLGGGEHTWHNRILNLITALRESREREGRYREACDELFRVTHIAASSERARQAKAIREGLNA